MRVVCSVLALAMLLAIPAGRAYAHAFGRLGVDHYIRVTPKRKALETEFDVHFGELPTAALLARLDTDRDGRLSNNEIMGYVRKATPVYVNRLSAMVTAGGHDHTLTFSVPDDGLERTCAAYVAKGEDGEKTFRIRWLFTTRWPDTILTGRCDSITLRVASLCRDNRHSSIFTTGRPEPPVRIIRSDVPTDRQVPLPPDITKQESDLSKIPVVLTANIVCDITGSRHQPEPQSEAFQPAIDEKQLDSGRKLRKAENKLRNMVFSLFQPPLDTYSRIAAIALCFLWGAMHAFTPGHGKAIVSAYLVSMRGSYGHAFLLGLLVTMTHTAVVLILAIVALILKDRFVYPQWLAPLGATMILLVGMNQIRMALMRVLRPHGHAHHHHHHGHAEHSHDHPHASEPHSHESGDLVRGRDIAVVGLSGGMVPCPASIVMILLAWQLSLPKLGLFCLISFSTGLAATLTLVGVLAVSGTRAVLKWLSSDEEEHGPHLLIATVMPAIGGIVLIVCGIVMLWGMRGP